jgi:alpha-beta hydrolase superfamily lysophospholipase
VARADAGSTRFGGHRGWWIALALLAVVAGALITGVGLRDPPAPPPEPGPFYDPPQPLPEGSAGTVVRARAIERPPAGSRAFRLLYLSRSHTGERRALSALLFVPRRPPPGGRRNVVAFTHGTLGVARRCAPSFDRTTWSHVAGLRRFLAAGSAVVVPDFEGLGTRGAPTSLVGAPQAWATLDAVRATAAFRPAEASLRFVAWGPGAGGQAALFTGQLAPSYAPELELAGVAAAAPATDLRGLLERTRNTTYGQLVAAYTLRSWSRIYGLPVADIVAPSGRRALRRLARGCVRADDAGLGGEVTARARELRYARPNPWDRPPWSRLLARNSPGRAAIAVPVLLAQGSADRLVTPAATRSFVRRLCASGTTAQLLGVDGARHADTARRSAAAVTRWIGDRFAGRSARTSC